MRCKASVKSVYKIVKCFDFSIFTNKTLVFFLVMFEYSFHQRRHPDFRVVTPGPQDYKSITNRSHIIRTILRQFTSAVLDSVITSAQFPPPPPQLWTRLIWARLADEERSGRCLINGGKKLNDSRHDRGSPTARHRNSHKLV